MPKRSATMPKRGDQNVSGNSSKLILYHMKRWTLGVLDRPFAT
jgi:hypothetical protein